MERGSHVVRCPSTGSPMRSVFIRSEVTAGFAPDSAPGTQAIPPKKHGPVSQSQAPVTIRAGRPYEEQLSASARLRRVHSGQQGILWSCVRAKGFEPPQRKASGLQPDPIGLVLQASCWGSRVRTCTLPGQSRACFRLHHSPTVYVGRSMLSTVEFSRWVGGNWENENAARPGSPGEAASVTLDASRFAARPDNRFLCRTFGIGP